MIRLEMILCQTQLKMASLLGNTAVQQQKTEQIVNLNIRQRIAMEQELIKQSFTTI